MNIDELEVKPNDIGTEVYYTRNDWYIERGIMRGVAASEEYQLHYSINAMTRTGKISVLPDNIPATHVFKTKKSATLYLCQVLALRADELMRDIDKED